MTFSKNHNGYPQGHQTDSQKQLRLRREKNTHQTQTQAQRRPAKMTVQEKRVQESNETEKNTATFWNLYAQREQQQK